jgi:diguanylate cyclase (GGDEF)-like protein
MITPNLPNNENSRLQELKALRILETPLEENFERLTRLAKHVFQVPIVAISLIDDRRQWFKSIQGLDVCETNREISFCGHAILQDDILIIKDALHDPRFFDNPLVKGEPFIRFYAGCPILSRNYKVGTLCVIDKNPRDLSLEERQQLKDIATLVENEIQQESLSMAQKTFLREINDVTRISLIDKQTRLWNQQGFAKLLNLQVDDSLQMQEGFGVAFIDIDNFGQINETYGKYTGNLVLKEVSKILLRHCRSKDSLGRWGGDEFVALINDSNLENIKVVAERFRSHVQNAQIKVDEDTTISVTVTIGLIHALPEHHLTPFELIEHAESVCKEAKKKGNKVKMAKSI